jgi:hypothetical protein
VADAPGSLHGFPASLTSFVGRAQAITEIAAQLAEYRLVTLTGPGGAGKTRLAGEVARRVAGRFADGVWLAELAAVRDPGQVPAAVAAALGIHDLPAVAAADALAYALAQRQLLLVLDNCEQVIGAATPQGWPPTWRPSRRPPARWSRSTRTPARSNGIPRSRPRRTARPR